MCIFICCQLFMILSQEVKNRLDKWDEKTTPILEGLRASLGML